MQIISVGCVAGVGGGDTGFYRGTGYLLRFSLNSTESFFEQQLPFLVETLDIDVRQIMQLELLSDGCEPGLNQTRILISFQAGECPEDAVLGRLCNEPSSPLRAFSSSDQIRSCLVDFLLFSPVSVRKRFMQAVNAALQRRDGERALKQNDGSYPGHLHRVSLRSGPPNIAEWRNVLLQCAERLRRQFRPELLDRVAYTAIPNTEDEYKVEADLLLPTVPRVYKPRSELRFRGHSEENESIEFTFDPTPPEEKLGSSERRFLEDFDKLDTQRRLDFWTKQLSKFFK